MKAVPQHISILNYTVVNSSKLALFKIRYSNIFTEHKRCDKMTTGDVEVISSLSRPPNWRQVRHQLNGFVIFNLVKEVSELVD